ncbi:hypothetical protein [Bradyrhizobium australiense]|uniref:Uncharacterized protein n=1 Tax=Bradyrhizobium australiense TaxID=2721161 RepID=A0A7Y4LVG5_9BRAD|nr:hypothetical protein [Bradyrhizobium australiense]NOJ40019.1 hypothetical protein [Bradyrhizobium australiense]
MAHRLLRLLEHPDRLPVSRLGKLGVVRADRLERMDDLATLSRNFILAFQQHPNHIGGRFQLNAPGL